MAKEEEVPLEELQAPVKRPSNPIKHALAGLASTPGDAVGFLGEVGAGLETLAKFPFNEKEGIKGFTDTFKESRDEGITGALTRFGERSREMVLDAADLEEPVSTEDQVGDLIGSLLIPTPHKFLQANKLAKLAILLTPAVRLSKGNKFDKDFAKRAVTQLGVGTGIHQGFRAAFDAPLLFSEEALHGRVEGEVSEEELLGGAGEVSFDDLQAPNDEVSFEDLQAPIPGEVSAAELAAPVEGVAAAQFREDDEAAEARQDAEDIRSLAKLAGIGATIFGIAKWRQIRAAERQGGTPTGTERQPQPSSAKEALGVIRAQKRRGDTKLETFNRRRKVTGQMIGNTVGKLSSDIFDRTGHIVRALRNVGVPQNKIDQISGIDIFDTPGQLLEFIESGELASGLKVTVPLRRLKRQFDTWDKPTRQEFLDYVSAFQEDAARVRATARDFIEKGDIKFDSLSKEGKLALKTIKDSFNKKEGFLPEGGRITGKLDELDALMMRDEWQEIIDGVRGTQVRERPGLFKRRFNQAGKEVGKTFVEDDVLFERIYKGEQNPAFVKALNDLAELNALVLRDSVKRGVHSEAFAASVQRQFTRGGRLLYLPGRTAKETEAWYKRLAVNMGFFTSEGKNLNRVGNMYAQSLKEGEGIAARLDPFKATAHYLGEMMEHTNRSVAQYEILKLLTGIRKNAKGVWEVGGPIATKRLFGRQKVPVYVGRVDPTDPLNQFGRINVKYHQYDPNLQKLEGLAQGDVRKRLAADDVGVNQSFPEQLADLEGALVIERQGEFLIFNNFDKGLKTALEFDPSLHGFVQKFGSFWKRVFTNFTTGKYSPFAPISALYNNQIGALNAALKAEGGFVNASSEAIQIWRDGIRGTWDFFATKVADDYAELLAFAIETNSGIAKMAPGWTRGMQKKFAQRAKKNMLAPIQRQIGKSATGFNLSQVDGDITDVLDQSAFYISQRFGGNTLPQFARIWKHLNDALHEGTAYGVTVRKLGGTAVGKTGDEVRQTRRGVSDLIGDNRLKGSNMDTFNAVVPFSGAMFQAWSTVGRAMKHAGAQRTIATLTTAVGLPTALEVTYNSMLDPEATFPDRLDPTKMWTYQDYYWKGFTTDQRNNNMIVFIPGRHPKEAILIPIVPEISLFRSLVIDAMEIVFGLSEMSPVSAHNKMEPNHLWGGVARTFNIPFPPPVKAAISALGIDIRAGPAVDEVDGSGVSFFQTINLPTGERATPNFGRTRFIGGEIETRAQAILQDILGAGGTAAVRFWGAMNDGKAESFSARAEAGLDSFAISMGQQARWVNPLFGKSLRNTPDPEVARAAVNKRDAIERFAKGLKNSVSGGGMSGSIPSLGDSIPVTQDPVLQQLQMNSTSYSRLIQPYVAAISSLRSEMASIGSTLILNKPGFGDIPAGPITIAQRDEILDAINLKIDENNHAIVATLSQLEEDFADDMFKATGRDFTGFTFDGYQERPNPSSASTGLPKPPRTSQ